MNVDQPDTTTTCEVCLDSDGAWVRAEIGLGARSLLIQPIEGDVGAVWLPYVDIRQLDEVDRSPTAAPGVRHLEIGLRDGRRPQVMLEGSVVEALLVALAPAQSVPSEAPPRPAEFDIGGPLPALAPTSAPPSPPPLDVSAPSASPFRPLDRAPLPEHTAPAGPFPSPDPAGSDATAMESAGAGSGGSSSRRNAITIGVALLALIALIALAVAVFTGGESDDVVAPDTSSPAPTTTAAETTTVPPLPSDPSDVLSVTALDVTTVTSDEGRSLYVGFEVRNLGDEEIAAYDLLLTVTVDEPAPAAATFQLGCATAPLGAGSSRQGQFRPDDTEANREQFSNCTVGGWPVDPADPAQVGLADGLAAGAVARTDVELTSVTLADGTTLAP